MATERFILDQHGSPIRRLMQYNPAETNSRQGGTIVFRAAQDVDAVLAEAKRARDEDQSKRTFRRVGTVPLIVYEQAVREGWANDEKAWERYLNENPAFKTWEGRL
jgi:hypothetical protein